MVGYLPICPLGSDPKHVTFTQIYHISLFSMGIATYLELFLCTVGFRRVALLYKFECLGNQLRPLGAGVGVIPIEDALTLLMA